MANEIKVASRSTPVNFKKALNRLANDDAFREAVSKSPRKLTDEYNLSLKELHALRQAAVLSGADMTKINRVRASAIATGGHVAADDINVSCCCCCCCGETGITRLYG